MDAFVSDYRFSGYRIIEFSSERKNSLKEIAERLIPNEQKILDIWIAHQYAAWEPPGFSKNDIRNVFGGLLKSILHCMDNRELEYCILDMEKTGSTLATSQFPFEALIISIHFLEESYMPFLLNPPSPKTQKWLISMDEFLHATLAAVSTAYFEAYRKDLLNHVQIGKIVQECLLADIPRNLGDLDVAKIYISAQESTQLGGDFLDYLKIDENRSAFLIGDMSGHGLNAAANSVMLRSLFKGFMHENPYLPEVMGRLNRVMISELDGDQFATALAITYDRSGKLSMVSAGHPYPIFCDGELCDLRNIDGMALGIRNQCVYSQVDTELKPGAMVVAYTDGLVEARKGSDFFGEDRAMKAISEMADAPARAVAEHLIDESLRFSGGSFNDDVALLVIKRMKAK